MGWATKYWTRVNFGHGQNKWGFKSCNYAESIRNSKLGSPTSVCKSVCVQRRFSHGAKSKREQCVLQRKKMTLLYTIERRLDMPLNPNDSNCFGCGPLHSAGGNLEFAQIFLDACASIEPATGYEDWTTVDWTNKSHGLCKDGIKHQSGGYVWLQAIFGLDVEYLMVVNPHAIYVVHNITYYGYYGCIMIYYICICMFA